ELTSLSEKVLMDLTKTYLAARDRQVTSEQQAVLAQCLRHTPSPLFAVMMAQEAASWQSSDAQNGTPPMPTTVTGLVEYLLLRLEKRFDRESMAAICSYLECAQNGLTETELLDLLSCNREVTESVGGDAGKVKRFPSMLWIRIKHDLSKRERV